MARIRTRPTPEILARIVGFYRQSGHLATAAARAGVGRSSVFKWKALGERQQSGMLRDFVDAFTHAQAERLTVVAQAHLQTALGGEIRVPKYDDQRRMVVDAEGRPQMISIVMPPNAKAQEAELRWLDPEYYGAATRTQVDVHTEVSLDQTPRLKAREMDDLLIDVMRRAKAMGISFEPAIETTAKPVDSDDESPAGEG